MYIQGQASKTQIVQRQLPCTEPEKLRFLGINTYGRNTNYLRRIAYNTGTSDCNVPINVGTCSSCGEYGCGSCGGNCGCDEYGGACGY